MRASLGVLLWAVGCAAPPPPEPEPLPPPRLTLEDVRKMVLAKVPEDVIVAKIQESGFRDDLSPDDLIRLHEQGFGAKVLEALVHKNPRRIILHRYVPSPWRDPSPGWIYP